MLKRLHLICNAHLDPVWLWEWEEGAAAALSTFRSAVRLAERFDYIFCHNEAMLYRWVEEYDPMLFTRIRELVAAKKWHIMGGWYLQPDCNLPAGESFVRQIAAGRHYFGEKFGVRPTTAVNFDPFGHSAGLVQILAKTGYDSYLCCRPGRAELDIPDDFIWEGADGSRVKCKRASGHYNSALGKAAQKIAAESERSRQETDLVLWGVGNHGGGPSAKDLSDIANIQSACGYEMSHSTPEAYFEEADCSGYVHRGGLNRCMPGCYTAMVRVKQLHRQLENALYVAERMLTHAACCKLLEYPHGELKQAEQDLLSAEFHDILPGSSIERAEEYGLRLLHHGIEICCRLRARAFFALSQGQRAAQPGTFPVLVYNPHPWPVRCAVDVGFNLEDQNYEEFFTGIAAYADGTRLPTQVVKEESNLNLDWMKRVRFRCELAPLSMNRFDLRKEILPAPPFLRQPEGEYYRFQSGDVCIAVNLKTGLVDSLVRGGREYLSGPLGRLAVYGDNEDPWAMAPRQLKELGTYESDFTLLSEPDGSAYSGVFNQQIPSVRITEDGEVLTEVEAVFGCGVSRAVVRYTLYKDEDALDVSVRLENAQANRIVRLCVPAMPGATCESQIAFGREALEGDGREQVMHRWVCCRGGGAGLAVINDGLYGVRIERNGEICLTLGRTAAYAAHPIGDRRITREDRFTPRMDRGERTYAFRVLFGAEAELEQRLEAEAALFNERPFALSVFPGEEEKALPVQPALSLSDSGITLSAFKCSEGGGVIVRLFNNGKTEKSVRLMTPLLSVSEELHFNIYEVKTLRIEGGKLTECEEMET